MAEIQRHKVLLALPGTPGWGAVVGMKNATAGHHDVTAMNCPRFLLESFNILWAEGLNLALAEKATHFAMCHADITPRGPWLDLLLWDMDRLDADLISAAIPLKDQRGLTTSGIGDAVDSWHPYRRFTTRELQRFPDVSDAAAVGYPERYLLHNTGCWVADLRKPLWRRTDDLGNLVASFQFPVRIRPQTDGTMGVEWESEDWYFSRMLAQLGAKSYISRKVHLTHRGVQEYPNDVGWGTYEQDEDSRNKWDPVLPSGAWTTTDESESQHKFDAGLASALVAELSGASVVDFGCGPGRYVKAFREAGIAADGCDGKPNTPALSGGLCEVADLTQPIVREAVPDWALCLEVLEHIPAEFESQVLDNLNRNNAKGVILSWAVPGQPGHGHVNCRPLEHVTGEFTARGYARDEAMESRLRAASSLPWFKNNLMVFIRNGASQAV